jgi:AraC-like DNA-binding protein
MFYVLCGRVRVWVDGREYEGKAGDLFFMLNGQVIRAQREGKGRVSTLSTGFRVDVGGAMSLLAWRVVPDKLRLEGQERRRFVRMFWELIRSVDGEGGLEAVSRLMFLLHEGLGHAGPERMPGDKSQMRMAAHDRGSLVLGMIERGLGGAITVTEMAGWANLSRGHFSRWFAGRMGKTPMRYVKERRVARAKALLSEGVGVEEVSRRVGYRDAAELARAYREETGEGLRDSVGAKRGRGVGRG